VNDTSSARNNVVHVVVDVAIIAACLVFTAVTFGSGAVVIVTLGSALYTGYQAGTSALRGEEITPIGVLDNLTNNVQFATGGATMMSNPVTATIFLTGTTTLGAISTVNNGTRFVNSLSDPNATTGEKWANGLDTALSAAGTVASGYTLGKSISNMLPQTNTGAGNYPPINGAVPGTEKTVTLQSGQTLGRYGEIRDNSNFVTNPGASPNSLALPSNTNPSVYTEIRVLKPIPGVTQSTITEWPIGSGTGGGLQYQLPMPLEILKSQGYISY